MRRHPPAWYVDPDDPDLLRYWDGRQWTSHTHPRAPDLQSNYQSGPTDGNGAPSSAVRDRVVVGGGIAVGLVIIAGALFANDWSNDTRAAQSSTASMSTSADASTPLPPAPTSPQTSVPPSPPPPPAAPSPTSPPPDDTKFIEETAFVMTVAAGGVTMDRSRLVKLGRDICTYLRQGHSALEAIAEIVSDSPTWSPEQAAMVVGASTGTLCEDQMYKTPG